MKRTVSHVRRLPGWDSLVLILLAAVSARAADPLPLLMETLSAVVPEQDGWFIEAPLGAIPGMPDDSRAVFDSPRVLVPTIDVIDLAVGKILAAGQRIPVKRITRYDHKPGLRGLPGFRGVLCEVDSQPGAGFVILTPHQNRFLIWARRQYFRELSNDSTPGKVRDWYARSVSDHLASIDYRVPDATPPSATERDLPAWMDLYPPRPSPAMAEDSLDSVRSAAAEMALWGCGGFTEIVPTPAMIERFITSAPETLYTNRDPALLQSAYRDFFAKGGEMSAVNALTRAAFDTLSVGWYIFGVDRYGRVRIADAPAPVPRDKPQEQRRNFPGHMMLFSEQPLAAVGEFEILSRDGQPVLRTVTIQSDHYLDSRFSSAVTNEISQHSDEHLLCLGHLFASLKKIGVPLDNVRIRKFR